MTTAYIGLGSNLGKREHQIEQALAAMNHLPGTTVSAVAPLEETRPIGPIQKQPLFMNTVAEIRTLLSPIDLLDGLLGIEQTLGRVRRERWGPRTIDLDILLYGDARIDHPRLRVPHPELWQRPFLLSALRSLHAV